MERLSDRTEQQSSSGVLVSTEGGIIFSDGIVDDAIEFNSGAIAAISIAPVQGRLVAN